MVEFRAFVFVREEPYWKNVSMTNDKHIDPRKITQSTRQRLFSMSGNQCAYPGCEQGLFEDLCATFYGAICHISAANKEGPRYKPAMTNEERRGYDNLILLCDKHHKQVDNNSENYSVEGLKKMKSEHIESVQNKLNKIITNESIYTVINAISQNIDLSIESSGRKPMAFGIKDKIKYNNLRRNAFIIQEYSIYEAVISSTYDELERNGSIKADTVQKLIHDVYLTIKGQVLELDYTVEDLQANADDIFDKVITYFVEKITDNSSDIGTIELSTRALVTYAFMDCKILEKPPGD